MEDQIISALQNPGISPEKLLNEIPKDISLGQLRATLFNVFRRITLNPEPIPPAITLEKLALLLDQLMETAESQPRRAGADQRKEPSHV